MGIMVFRVLKAGGHFSISDIVLVGELPKKLQEAAEMYAGCVAGASQKNKPVIAVRVVAKCNYPIWVWVFLKIEYRRQILYLSMYLLMTGISLILRTTFNGCTKNNNFFKIFFVLVCLYR